MKTYKVFVYWIITIITGSIALTISSYLISEDNISITNFFESNLSMMIFYSLIFSFLFSLPSLLFMLIFNLAYQRREYTVKKVFIGKTIIILLSFFAALIFLGLENLNNLFVIILCYAPVGYFFWWREFKRIESKAS